MAVSPGGWHMVPLEHQILLQYMVRSDAARRSAKSWIGRWCPVGQQRVEGHLMGLHHKAIEFGFTAACIACVAVIGAYTASGDPPDGKGGGGGFGGNNPPPDPVWVAWFDPAVYAMDCGNAEPDWCPSSPPVDGMGPAFECVMNAKDGTFVRSELFNRDFVFSTGQWDYDWPDGVEPCPSCGTCTTVWPSVDPEGLIPTEYPLTTHVALHLQLIDGTPHVLFLMSAVPNHKALRYATPPIPVKEVIDYADGAFDLVVREDAVPLYRTSGPDQDVVFGYVSLGDVRFAIWTP